MKRKEVEDAMHLLWRRWDLLDAGFRGRTLRMATLKQREINEAVREIVDAFDHLGRKIDEIEAALKVIDEIDDRFRLRPRRSPFI